MKKIKEAKDILINLDSNPIYIAGHIKPDQDSIGSCLALARFLNSIGKKAYVLLEDKDRDIINWQNDYSLIVNDVHDNVFNFIALDLNEKKRLGKFETYFDKALYTINIDHHQDNKNEANFTLSIPGISSTCEMIYSIIESYGKEYFSTPICENLYAGILNDTNCFTRRISSQTFKTTQKLINKGINYPYIIKKTLKERTMYEFKALSKLINQIEYDGFHYVIIDMQDENFKDLTHNQIVKKLAEDLRTIEGMDVFILLIKKDNIITSKCMSNISENADKIASLFGGGGHKKEAGFTTDNLSTDEIISKIKNYLNIKKVKLSK